MKAETTSDKPSPPTLRHFSASLPMMLLRAREAVMQRFRRMLRENGLTEQQWRVLRALSTETSIEISALARSTVLLPPSLSRILPELAGQRLVSIEPDERDQRRKLVSLTARGAMLIQAIAPLSERIYAEITEKFGSERLQRLQSLLLELEADLQIGAADVIPVAEGSVTGERSAPGRQLGKKLTR